MRNAPRRTVLVIGDTTTATAAINAATGSEMGYAVYGVDGIDEIPELPDEVRDDIFAVVLDAPKDEALAAIDARLGGLLDEEIGVVLVSDDRFSPTGTVDTPEGEPFPIWSNSFVKPVDVEALREELDDLMMMEDTAPTHPLEPGEEQANERAFAQVQRMIDDAWRRHALATHEIAEETHALDFFEMLANEGDDITPSEWRVLQRSGLTEEQYVAARARLRAAVETLPEERRRDIDAALSVRRARRS